MPPVKLKTDKIAPEGFLGKNLPFLLFIGSRSKFPIKIVLDK
jgi:hypothetical protein